MIDYKTPEQIVAELIERGFDLPEDYEPSSYGETFDRIDEALVQGYIGPEDVIRLMREAIEADREQRTWQVSPSDDEREALARVIRENRSIAKIMSDGYVSVIQAGDDEITDAILASDVWRNRRQGPITDEMVERACIAFTCDSAEEWFELAATYRASIWSGMRAALEAAERARSDVPSPTEQESYR
jgi:hypothetical protein